MASLAALMDLSSDDDLSDDDTPEYLRSRSSDSEASEEQEPITKSYRLVTEGIDMMSVWLGYFRYENRIRGGNDLFISTSTILADETSPELQNVRMTDIGNITEHSMNFEGQSMNYSYCNMRMVYEGRTPVRISLTADEGYKSVLEACVSAVRALQ